MVPNAPITAMPRIILSMLPVIIAALNIMGNITALAAAWALSASLTNLVISMPMPENENTFNRMNTNMNMFISGR